MYNIDSSEGDDSSDEEGAASNEKDDFETNRPVVLLSEEDRDALTKKTKRTTSGPPSKPGVVFLGRIPHGFYEKEMRAYFSQFGEVTRLRLSRNKKVRSQLADYIIVHILLMGPVFRRGSPSITLLSNSQQRKRRKLWPRQWIITYYITTS